MRLWLKLTAIAIAGIGSLVWVAVQVGRLGGPAGLFRDTYALDAEFADATGLLEGDEVRLAGVRIGTVNGVSVEDGDAVVELTIDAAHSVPVDSRFELRWRSVLGQRFVQVLPPTDASPSSPAIPAGQRIGTDATGDAADLTALLNDLEPMLGTLDTGALNRVMTTLAGVLEGREQQVGDAISSSSQLLSHLNRRADELGGTITNLATILDGLAARDQETVALLDSLARTSEALATQSGSIGDAVAESGEFVHVLDETLAANEGELDTVIDQLRQITGTVANRDRELSEGLRTLAWSSAALLRATSHGDWIQVYGRGFGVINTFTPEPRVGPDYSDVGPDDTEAPEPIGGQPSIPVPDLPQIEVGPLTVNPSGEPLEVPSVVPTPGLDDADHASDDRSSGLERLLLPLRSGGGSP